MRILPYITLGYYHSFLHFAQACRHYKIVFNRVHGRHVAFSFRDEILVKYLNYNESFVVKVGDLLDMIAKNYA